MERSGLCFRILINVAGVDFEGIFTDRTPEQIRTILRLNIEANLEMTYTVLKLRDSGQVFRIINVASLAAFYPMPVKAIYAASKRFLLNFSMALREELRTAGCTVTALCPAGMPTTAECIRAIDAQGLAGIITTKNVGFVAAKTLDHALKGHAVYIPGFLNRLLRLLGSFLPASVIAYMIGSRWKAARLRNEILQAK
jgi:short-subunit dehydrogenase